MALALMYFSYSNQIELQSQEEPSNSVEPSNTVNVSVVTGKYISNTDGCQPCHVYFNAGPHC